MADSTATTPDKIIIKHRYTDAVLFEYQPTAEQQDSGLAMRAALEAANLRGANLDGAYLRGANLDGANLSGANLRGADLRGEKKLIGKRPVFTVGPIGSRSDFFTAYITDKGLFLRAGCFFGTESEFTTELRATHGTNKHAQEYTAALELARCHARLWTSAEKIAAAEEATEE